MSPGHGNSVGYPYFVKNSLEFSSRLSDADAYLRNSAGMSFDDFPFFNAHWVDLISFLSGGKGGSRHKN